MKKPSKPFETIEIKRLFINMLLIVFLISWTQSAFTQTDKTNQLPTITSFEVKLVSDNEKSKIGTWMEFYWETENALLVKLYKNGSEIPSRTKRGTENKGWPLSMDGGFRIQAKSNYSFELLAVNRYGETSKIWSNSKDKENHNTFTPPEILSFKIESADDSYYHFFWEVKNAFEVKLYDSFGEIKPPTNFSNVKSGWPLSMKGAYQEQLKKPESYRLIAKSKEGEASEWFVVNIAEKGCKINVSFAGKYSQFTKKLGVYEAKKNGLGKFLFQQPVKIIRDHRKGKDSSAKAKCTLILDPGSYTLVASGGGKDKHGNFGVIYKPGRIGVSCKNGIPKDVIFKADFAEY